MSTYGPRQSQTLLYRSLKIQEISQPRFQTFECCLLQGVGDCDRDDQCQAGLVCGSDNCLRWREAGGYWQAEDDCCQQRSGKFERIRLLYGNTMDKEPSPSPSLFQHIEETLNPCWRLSLWRHIHSEWPAPSYAAGAPSLQPATYVPLQQLNLVPESPAAQAVCGLMGLALSHSLLLVFFIF